VVVTNKAKCRGVGLSINFDRNLRIITWVRYIPKEYFPKTEKHPVKIFAERFLGLRKNTIIRVEYKRTVNLVDRKASRRLLKAELM
jgi:hypothetical protein